ncbi:hypothetical protein Ahy_B09g095442 isoform A [Arachis hypogaea]|uniref:Ubiquitin-like protease family profile domain-containing protein n=2 Tax=Arachis hypogaea TaxID=3818 RepID=A0A444XDW1_ARAHY|nr:hypothetical protein Ahy_B09g095442 isoform A [Arachis hypogaea]
MADVKNKKFHVLDLFHKKSPLKERTQLNKFVGYLISRMRVFVRGQPLTKKDDEIKAPYVNIVGQHTNYDYVIYVMKWLEIIEPQNIKKSKYEWDNWTQAEVNHFRVEYASLILFDEMNRLRDRAIQESEAIRLSKPSAALLSPYCELRSEDIDSE